MTEQKPHWINLTCMKCGYRYSGLTHAAPSACPNDGESLVPYDPPAQRIASLEAELAQVKAERDAANKELRRIADEHCRLNEGVANNLGRPGLHNVFDDDVIRGAGEVRRRAESAERLCRELAVGLNSVLADQTVHLHFTALSGLAVGTCVCCRCNALALLSRPEAKKILEGV